MENAEQSKKSKIKFSFPKPTTKSKMIDMLIALIPLVVFAIYKYHFDAAIKIFLSAGFSILTEVLILGILTKPNEKIESKFKRFLSRFSKIKILNITAPAITGIIYALLLPSSISYYVLIFGAIFATSIAKMVYGGTGKNIFNPAVTARMFVTISFVILLQTGYANIPDSLTTGDSLQHFRQTQNFTLTLEKYSIIDLFTGFSFGAMGEINKLAILVGGLYLIIRGVVDYKTVLSILLPFTLFTFIIALGYTTTNSQILKGFQVFDFYLFQLFSGTFMFAIFYLAVDPVTSPKNLGAKFIYGFSIAVITLVIRSFGGNIDATKGIIVYEGVGFAILLGNTMTSILDRFKSFKKISWQLILTYSILVVSFVPIFYFGIGGSL